MPVQVIFNAYTANGATTVFPYGFLITAEEDLQVSVAGVVVTTGFTVSGVGDEGGGSVTFSVAPLNGQKVLLELFPILKRTTDYQQFGDWLATVANLDFDRLVLMMQRAFRDITQSLRLEVDSSASALLPTPVANKALFWNSTGDAIEYRDLSSVVAVGADDVHAATSKATLVDADELPLVDSAASWVLKKFTLTTLWTWIKTHLAADCGGQIKFPAAKNSSTDTSTLDEYREMVWTPAFSFDTDPTGLTYSTQVGHAIKIGKFVFVQMRFVLTSKGAGGVGALYVTTVPLAGADYAFIEDVSAVLGTAAWGNMTTSLISLQPARIGSGAFVFIKVTAAITSSIGNYLTWADLSDTTRIDCTLVYKATF